MKIIYQKTNPTSQNAGFTLIELLVVVLIIGILAAVALPQYSRSVDKAELARVRVMMADLLKAENLFYLANRNYTNNMADLDLDWPGFEQNFAWDDKKYYQNATSGYTIGIGSTSGVSIEVKSMKKLTFSESYAGVRSCSNETAYPNGQWLCKQWKGEQ